MSVYEAHVSCFYNSTLGTISSLTYRHIKWLIFSNIEALVKLSLNKNQFCSYNSQIFFIWSQDWVTHFFRIVFTATYAQNGEFCFHQPIFLLLLLIIIAVFSQFDCIYNKLNIIKFKIWIFLFSKLILNIFMFVLFLFPILFRCKQEIWRLRFIFSNFSNANALIGVFTHNYKSQKKLNFLKNSYCFLLVSFMTLL